MPQVELLSVEGLKIPSYATTGSSGMDICADISSSIVLESGQSALIPTGLRVAIPQGYEIQIRPRSGLAFNHSVTVLNTPGTIDADYRGEIGVILINHGKSSFAVEPNMRIAQMVLSKVETIDWIMVDKLSETVRGEGGFGHTGTK